MSDAEVLLYISQFNGKFKFKNLPLDIKEYLLNRYSDSLSIQESYFRLKNNLEEHPKCIICGNNAKFNGRFYINTCCFECTKKFNKLNREKTCLEKYGVKNPYQVQSIITHIQTINKKKRENSNIKLKRTNNLKYGGNSPTSSSEIKNKVKKTCLEKYGVENSYLIPKVKENCKSENINNRVKHNIKRKKTCLEKYGVDNVFKIEEIRNKSYKTKKENGTFITSKFEEYCFNKLNNKFKKVIRQYKSKEYPFFCDFYIDDINTYIEIQGTWSHGPHPYNPNNIDDQKLLEYWKNKTSLYYKRSIKGWTIDDPLKRKIAKENNLNYLEFFNKIEFDNWINTL